MATKIQWAEQVWNPITGCSKISEGCRNCYAERISLKWGWSAKDWSHRNAAENVVLHPERLRKPYSWKKPCRIFVNSMSDLYHEQVPDPFISSVFRVMAECPHHCFQVLTKRAERMAIWEGPWCENIWQGVSVENCKALYRIDLLRQCQAKVRFLSIEPLLEPLGTLDLAGIDWVIVGGESGEGHRPMRHAWAREIRDQCVEWGVPFFFKQSSAYRPGTGKGLEEIDGTRTVWHQYPNQ